MSLFLRASNFNSHKAFNAMKCISMCINLRLTEYIIPELDIIFPSVFSKS